MMLPADADKDGKVALAEVGTQPGIVRFLDKIDREFGNADGLVDSEEWNKAQAPALGKGGLAALDLSGRGDVTDSHYRWRYTKQVAQIPSILVFRDVLYMVQDGGLLTTFNPDSGEQMKRGRLSAGGQYYASPIAGDDKVYVINTAGQTNVIKAGRSWESISNGELGEQVWATPAIVDGSIFVRSEKTMWCFKAS